MDRFEKQPEAAGDAMVQEPVPGGFLQTNSRTQAVARVLPFLRSAALRSRLQTMR